MSTQTALVLVAAWVASGIGCCAVHSSDPLMWPALATFVVVIF